MRGQVRRTDRAVSAGTWLIAAGAILYSLLTGTPLVRAHSPAGWEAAAWVLPAVTDVAFLVALQADIVVSRLGVSAGGWPVALRLATGAASIYLNVWGSVEARDPVGVATHLIAPGLLVLAAQAGPAYRRALACELAAAEERERQRRVERAERERAEQAERSERAAEARRVEHAERRADEERRAERAEQREREARQHDLEVRRLELAARQPAAASESVRRMVPAAVSAARSAPAGAGRVDVRLPEPEPAPVSEPVVESAPAAPAPESEPVVEPVVEPVPESAPAPESEPTPGLEVDRALIRQGWEQGWSLRRTAAHAGCSPTTVRKVYGQLSLSSG